MPGAGDHAPPMTRSRGGHRGRPVRLLRGRPAAQGRRGGRPVRRAADAVRARAGRRRSRPPEDQVGHADVRADRPAPGLPLLRRGRGRRGRDGRRAARALSRGRLRGRHADRQPARDPGRRPAGLGLRDAVRRLVQRPPRPRRRGVRPVVLARRGDRQRQRGDRRRADARARPRRARVDRHRRPRDRGVRPRLRHRGGHPRAPGAGAGRVHEPRAARAGRAHACRRPRRARRPRRRGPRRSPAHGAPQHGDAAQLCRAAARPGARTGSCCASAARRSRSSATASTAP